MQQLRIENIENINSIAIEFLNKVGNKRVFAFYGEMGAGKTTFIKAICSLLGVKEEVSSPTFAIINEYKANGGQPVYHFDFYRIEKEEEAFDFGYEEYFYSGNYCFIEWPERIADLLPVDSLYVKMVVDDKGVRNIYWDEK